MPEINPLAVIAECIEKAKATTDQELISDYIAEALEVLQIDNPEDDAFKCWAVPSSTQSQTTRSIPPVCSRSGPSWRSSGSCRNGLQVERIAAALDHGSAFATSGGSVTGRIWAAIEMPVIPIGSEAS